MSNLPLEFLDSILQKSYLLRVLREEEVLKNKDYQTISQLASVDCCWFQRIRRRKFKKEFWRSLFVLYQRKEKASSIYKINQQYLEENIRLKGIVNRLKSNDCLTDVQAASLYGRNLPFYKKNCLERVRDLISEIVKKKEAIQSIFSQCLRHTKQHLVAEVIENGGVTIKDEIKLQNDRTSVKTRHQNLQIAEGINKLRGKTKARKSENEDLIGKLKDDDLEILNASRDGDVIIVWIWCQTKHALEKLQTMNKSKRVIDIFTELTKNLSFSSEEKIFSAKIKPKVNIDFEQFEKTVVFFSIVAKFTSRLDLRKGEYEEVEGVTKLRNKIHVLVHRFSVPRCLILVFEDQIPFRPQKRIEIKEIEFPTDIASIEMENSLYVLDFRRCVWKIKEGDEKEKKKKIIRRLELGVYYDGPWALSVTRDGQLLTVGLRKEDRLWSLWIFGGSEKADLYLSIPLSKDIYNPDQAVETSKGNFIISHKIILRKTEDGVWRQTREEQMELEMKGWTWGVSEVSGDGETILRRFFPKNEKQKLSAEFNYLIVDSLDRVFLTDRGNRRVILLDSNLQWNGILIPTEEDGKEGKKIIWPTRLFYDEEKKGLIVGVEKEVFVYNLNKT